MTGACVSEGGIDGFAHGYCYLPTMRARVLSHLITGIIQNIKGTAADFTKHEELGQVTRPNLGWVHCVLASMVTELNFS